MNRNRFRTERLSSARSTDIDDDDNVDDEEEEDEEEDEEGEEDWSTDDSSSISSFHGKAIWPSSIHRRNQMNDGKNPETDPSHPEPVKRKKKKQGRQDSQSIPLVPFIEEKAHDDQFPTAQTSYTHTPTRTSVRNPHHHRHHRRRRPALIEIIQTEWHNARFKPPGPHHEDGLPNLEQILSAPKVRRWGLVGFVFLGLLWVNWGLWARARWREHTVLKNAVSGGKLQNGFGSFGTNMRAEFGGLVHLRSLGEDYGVGRQGRNDESRLVVVGDVHGCIDELQNLLTEVSFNADHDHLICTGDIISKGPASGEVIDLLISMKASCVRGNHEDRILLTYQDLKSRGLIPQPQSFHETEQQRQQQERQQQPFPSIISRNFPRDSEEEEKKKTVAVNHQSDRGESADRDRDLARSLTPTQIQYLYSCPVILRLGLIPGMGETIVVHGGLVPGVELEKQDPVSVMNMRTLDLETRVPSRSPEGMAWNELWTKYQTYLPPTSRSTVIYGHDSRRGLQLTQYTKGLDTGCVKGGRLTALVIKYDGSEPTVVSVECKDYRAKKKKKAGGGGGGG